MRVWFYNNGGIGLICWHSYCNLDICSLTTNLQNSVQGFAESLQQECSKPAQNVMIELYCCGPGLLFWLLLFQIRKSLGSRFCCKDSAKLCIRSNCPYPAHSYSNEVFVSFIWALCVIIMCSLVVPCTPLGLALTMILTCWKPSLLKVVESTTSLTPMRRFAILYIIPYVNIQNLITN